MIVGSLHKVPIGFRGDYLRDNNRERVRQPFIVIREATFEEYLEQLDIAGIKKAALTDFDFTHNFFYEVSTD